MPTPRIATETLLLKQPTLNATHIAFVYAGDLWAAELDGGRPQRLTAEKGRTLAPMFSPDGRTIAFSGDYDGSMSVYAIPLEGGSPQRLTYHPDADVVTGLTCQSQGVPPTATATPQVQSAACQARQDYPLSRPVRSGLRAPAGSWIVPIGDSLGSCPT